MFSYLKNSSTKELFLIFGACAIIAIAATIGSLMVYFFSSGIQSIGFLSAIADFWGLILGLPITAAGAIFAIMLAQRSIDISHQQVEQEKISIALSEKVAEQEALAVISKQWEDTTVSYEELASAIKECDSLCSQLVDWHFQPKQYLAYRSSELTLCAKGSVYELNQTLEQLQSKHNLTAEQLKKMVESQFRVTDCESLLIDNNKLKLDQDINLDSAATQFKEFSQICNDLREALDKVSQVLLKLSLSPMSCHLWETRFRELSPSTLHKQSIDYYTDIFEPFSAFSFREDLVHSKPSKLAMHINRYVKEFSDLDMFLASQSIDIVEHAPALKLLDIWCPIRIKSFGTESELHFNNLIFSETNDEISLMLSKAFETEGSFESKAVYKASAIRGLGWALIADIVRLLPTQQALSTYISDRFDLSDENSSKIANLVFTDTTNLFRTINGVDNHSMDGDNVFCNHVSFQDEECNGYFDIRVGAAPLTPTLVASSEYLSFLERVFSSNSYSTGQWNANKHYLTFSGLVSNMEFEATETFVRPSYEKG
ncbi:TPA: hypothetical protein RQL27_000383 [Vibrio vulnificus]|uniref:hypothetical protein n=1 Tax=Vibrio vulnificus TaxID=672 RepID=UPI000B4D8E1B|nr:hypothetical protein [Vibrio vulnificus]ASC59213.1 hypothetical protein FORC37_3519 [Vibrio vulnificus]HAS6186497.1 hypothetical protein [Vibrio vulnificus]HDY7957062.1 hypothetical protein [Vibrio vulnificus]HDY8124146.1 hypothetical protein [Vibrio vulnificus]HDY8142298.1 hypothetical protein [Vibrio vulnificus]